MLVDFSQMKNCYLVCGYTDLRKGIDGLASVITSQFQLDLLDESVLVFSHEFPIKLVSTVMITGEKVKVYVFVATLPCSQLSYVEGSLSMDLAS